MLIMFAESMVLSFSNLKLINGNAAFFSIVINRNNETIDAAEKMISPCDDLFCCKKYRCHLFLPFCILSCISFGVYS